MSGLTLVHQRIAAVRGEEGGRGCRSCSWVGRCKQQAGGRQELWAVLDTDTLGLLKL